MSAERGADAESSQTQSNARLGELVEKFEEIEHQRFGKDGFDDAVERIARIEQSLGLGDLGHYTASPPPKYDRLNMTIRGVLLDATCVA